MRENECWVPISGIPHLEEISSAVATNYIRQHCPACLGIDEDRNAGSVPGLAVSRHVSDVGIISIVNADPVSYKIRDTGFFKMVVLSS